MARISRQRARRACVAAHENLYIGLRSREPALHQLPIPPDRVSRERVIEYIDCFQAHIAYSMRMCKAAGYFGRFLNTTTDPAKAGLVFVFDSPAKLHQVSRRLNLGALVDPTGEGILATFCGADGHMSGELYDEVAARGRNLDDLMFAIVVNFEDEAGVTARHYTLVYEQRVCCCARAPAPSAPGGAVAGAPDDQ